MAIPSSGALSFTAIQTEFGGSGAISLSEYYAGGAYVYAGATGDGGAIPSSGEIAVGDFYGSQTGTVVSDIYGTVDKKADGTQWSNSGNTIIEDTSYASVNRSSGTDSENLGYRNWGASVSGTLILVTVAVYCRKDPVYNTEAVEVFFQGPSGAGTAKSTAAAGGDETISFSGDTTYWGLSNADLISALNSTIATRGLRMKNTISAYNASSDKFRCYWVKTTAVYTP